MLKQAGYRGYLFCRPDAQHLPLLSDDFLWVGYDGSTVLAHRSSEHYNSERGRARAKVERWLQAHEGDDDGVLLWGVGNHGGGPSRDDLRALAALARDTADRTIVHGAPEDYFDRLAGREGCASAARGRPESVGAGVLHLDVHREARSPPARGPPLRHREDARERGDSATDAVPPRRAGLRARGAALLRVPRHPARARRSRRSRRRRSIASDAASTSSIASGPARSSRCSPGSPPPRRASTRSSCTTRTRFPSRPP